MSIKHESIIFSVYLGALSAIPPLSIDMGLPGIPAIEAAFPDASGRGALTLSLFLAGFAISPSICGPVADRFGRRMVLLTGLLFFSLGAVASAFAGSFELLLLYRLLQGVAAGACVVLPLAIVRDLFDGTKALVRLSQVTAVLGIAPMAAPVLGGWVMSVSDWRMIYLIQAILGLILFIVTLSSFAESLPLHKRRSLAPRQLFASYAGVFKDKRFVGFALVGAFGFACMFSYISGSSAVFMGEFGLSETAFSLIFAITSCGMLLGSLLSGRLSKKAISSHRIIMLGLAGMGIGGGLLFLSLTVGFVNVAAIALLVTVVIFSFGLITPGTSHEALQNLGHIAGSASGIMRAIQMLFGAIASALIAALEPTGNPALNMASLMLVSLFLASGTFYMVMRRERASRTAPVE